MRTQQLQGYLGSLGLKDVLGGVAAGIGGSAAVQLAFMRPTAGGKLCFPVRPRMWPPLNLS
ncbi:hypothetical protein [Nonomuraea dietziae]|uniref:hypothetical protein n=1 Tax=Nonomuraea dietziae TaxID=65515 RepID=UPI003439C74C